MQVFAGEIVDSAEALAVGKEALAQPLLLSGEADKLRVTAVLGAVAEPDEKTLHQRRDGSVMFGGLDASLTIRLYG